ncbi:S-methyl-5-thioadenosine phosphorylase [Brettanomyces nanus]|uniref:S-methyl-5'-thioadenosine phosphorylase n=1 Tax=Eeniella nana TaxID=13502 RepID=A0A875S0N4_EENNA|nr:S-methyl-5-thioadenosine phosphorylase [Brettanomyces nanus]QPG73429.1 S-methyl-5-thioadenosine phosphorylase [Brettanomyces nanus]
MSELAHEFREPVTLAIIGGTGLYRLQALKPIAKLSVSTPWGMPSSQITIARTKTGFPIAFLTRHGPHHDLQPSDIPYRANIAALKKIGVKVILAFSAVGSLQEHIKPRDFVIPNQIIDRTKGIRKSTFFERGFVAHAGFGEPFDPKLNKIIGNHCSDILEGDGVRLHTKETEKRDVTLVCMEGPAFSTRAESQLYKSWGGAVINMSCIPEAKLAREAEIAYQMICMSTDYDAWNESEEPVTVEQVVGNLQANSDNAHKVAEKLIQILEPKIASGEVGSDLSGSMKFSVSTKPPARDRRANIRMHYLFPNYWPLE